MQRRTAGVVATFSLAAALSAAASGAAELLVRIDGGAPADLQSVTVLSHDGKVSAVGIAAAGPTTVPLSGRGPWLVGCQGAEWSCTTREVSAAQEPLALVAARGGGVDFKLDGPSTSLPKWVIVEASAAARDHAQAGPALRPSVVMLVEGKAQFSLQPGDYDLRMGIPGAAPVYRQAIKVAAGKRTDLGRVPYHRGGSVAGWVVRRADGVPVPKASISLQEPTSRGPSVLSAETDQWGFFQIAGVPPGAWNVAFSHPDRASAVLEGVVVKEDSETQLEKIPLGDPTRLEIVLTPPAPSADERWSVDLRRPGASPTDAKFVDADSNGLVVLANVVPGSYQLAVLGAGSMVERRLVDVLGGSQQIDITLPLTGVVGLVEMGDEPLRARVGISTGAGEQIWLETDAEGTFSGLVREPAQRVLFVTVQSSEPQIARQLEVVDPPREDGVLVLDLAFSKWSLEGTVSDERGTPIPATVLARPTSGAVGSRLSAETDQLGNFAMAGFDQFSYQVWAEDKLGGRSDIVVLDLGSSVSPPELDLVVRKARRIEALLLDGAGAPISGAAVIAYGVGGSPGAWRAGSDAVGKLALQLPDRTSAVVVVVEVPGTMLWSGCLQIPREGTLEIRLPDLSETAIVELATRFDNSLPPATSGGTALLTGAGGFIELSVLSRWSDSLAAYGGGSRTDGEKTHLSVVRLAPGRYSAIFAEAEGAVLASPACQGAIPTSWSMAPAGGSVGLELDVREFQRAALRRGRG